MAGTQDGFDAAAFREGIQFAMNMGAPVAAGDQVKFYFPPATATVVSHDDTGLPFNPAEPPVTTTPAPVTVPCAVEFDRQEGEHDRIGFVVPNRLRVLLLDTDYDQVQGCSHIVYGGDRYDLRYEEPPNALFDAGVHTMVFVARGER